MEKTMEKLVKEAQVEARMQGLPIDQIGEFVADYIKNHGEVKKETPNRRTKSASEVIKGHNVASWFSISASEEEKKELLEAYTAWRKSREVKDEEPSEIFDELVKLTGFSTEIDYEAELNKAIKNLNNRWHGWFCTMTQIDNGDTYAKYEDGSYVTFNKEGQAVIFIKGDEEFSTEVYKYDDFGDGFAWKEENEYVNNEKKIDHLKEIVHTAKMTVAVYPHGMYDDMDWIVDWVYNHVIFRSLNEIAKGNGELHKGDDGEGWFYEDEEEEGYFGFYSLDDDDDVFDDDECKWVKGEHVCAKFVDFERPYRKGAWKAVLGFKYPVEVTEEMTALLNKISDIHNK